jgi:hypothetical protein
VQTQELHRQRQNTDRSEQDAQDVVQRKGASRYIEQTNSQNIRVVGCCKHVLLVYASGMSLCSCSLTVQVYQRSATNTITGKVVLLNRSYFWRSLLYKLAKQQLSIVNRA